MYEPIGNPIFLLLERMAYLGIGIFFVAALVTSILRNKKETHYK